MAICLEHLQTSILEHVGIKHGWFKYIYHSTLATLKIFIIVVKMMKFTKKKK
jgi:hypothetical protein